MTDFFALLDEPRRPWIDPEALQAKFFALSAEVHPDRFHNTTAAEKQSATQRYTELNSAYNCLREPRERLRHLLTLEIGTSPSDIHAPPAGTLELLSKVASLCRTVDGFLDERAKVHSPLLQVQLFDRSQEWTDKLSDLRRKVAADQEQLHEELKAMNADWSGAPPSGSPAREGVLPLKRLEQVYRVLSYTDRWAAQIQDRLVKLSI